MRSDNLYNPYKTSRAVSYGKNGMVATSQNFAAEAGFEILKNGGNAVDAAVATAAALTVCEPTSNGIGGDAFAIVYYKGKLYGLNSSGPSPEKISVDMLRSKGYKQMPRFGWAPVNVPGIPAAWSALWKRFGKLPFEKLLAPSVEYAEEGYPVTPTVGHLWEKSYREFKHYLKGDEFKYWFETFSPKERAPRIGEIVTLRDHGKTLKTIAETLGEAFYRGELAEKIDKFSKDTGGYIRREDLEKFQPEWMDPISVNYRGYDVYEMPPNGQGITALMALNILKGFEFGEKDSVDTCHKQIEAIKLAFEDSLKYVTDAKKMKVNIGDLLSESYAEERRKQITETAFMPKVYKNINGGTVYLATADGEGNMVSYIQSNYMGFGSGLVVPGTGIALHNRGNSFSLDPNHVNFLEPEKKPYHTIIPGFLMKGNRPIGPFGVMGAFMQPQGHIQVLMNFIDFGLNPQAALDAPRWFWTSGKNVSLEKQFSSNLAENLYERGHDVDYEIDTSVFGRGQIIWKNEEGVLFGGTDWRSDGTVYSW